MSINIYAITDSHQETRNLATLLSGVYDFEKTNSFLLLDCGDLFKGIYNPDLSVDTYIKFKKLCPNSQIVMTLGNNDFGFDQKGLDYLKSAINKFENAGINIVCANIKPQIVPKYKIVNINGKKILITGFCLQTSVVNNLGFELEDCKKSFAELEVNEDYDKIIILNHHWYPYSRDLYEFAKPDLIIGGHEHSPIVADYERNIYYPLAFARTLYKMQLDNNIKNVEQIPLEKFKILSEFDTFIRKYENENELFKPIAKRVLNLWKRYSEPCPLGTFISDNMKRVANTDIAFHSTGFTMYQLSTDTSNIITKYDFEKVICASTPIVKLEIDTNQLKKVFENATSRRMYKNNGNSRFLQCSNNISITGQGNVEDKTYKIIQITIDGIELLDNNGEPIYPKRKFTCAVDKFIASGEQGYEVLKKIPHTTVLQNGEPVQLNKLLLQSLQIAQDIFPPNSEYCIFTLHDLPNKYV